jgi:hypothetical protein
MKKAHAGAGENGNFVFLKLLRWTSELLVRRLSESTAFKIICQMTNYTKVIEKTVFSFKFVFFKKKKIRFVTVQCPFYRKINLRKKLNKIIQVQRLGLTQNAFLSVSRKAEGLPSLLQGALITSRFKCLFNTFYSWRTGTLKKKKNNLNTLSRVKILLEFEFYYACMSKQ